MEIQNAYDANKIARQKSLDFSTTAIAEISRSIQTAASSGEFSIKYEISKKREATIEIVMDFFRARGYTTWYSPPFIIVSWAKPERLENV